MGDTGEGKGANKAHRRTLRFGDRAASGVVWVDGVLVWEYTVWVLWNSKPRFGEKEN